MATRFSRKTPLFKYTHTSNCIKCGRNGAFTAKWHNANRSCFGRHEEHMHIVCMCGWEWLCATHDCDGIPDVREQLKAAAARSRARVTLRIIETLRPKIPDVELRRKLELIILHAASDKMDIETVEEVLNQ